MLEVLTVIGVIILIAGHFWLAIHLIKKSQTEDRSYIDGHSNSG